MIPQDPVQPIDFNPHIEWYEFPKEIFDMKFPSGLVATCASSYGYGCNRYRVVGTKGWVEAEPFLSYGGTALLTLFIGVGMLMSIGRHRTLVQG